MNLWWPHRHTTGTLGTRADGHDPGLHKPWLFYCADAQPCAKRQPSKQPPRLQPRTGAQSSSICTIQVLPVMLHAPRLNDFPQAEAFKLSHGPEAKRALQSPAMPLAQLPHRLSVAPPVAVDLKLHCPCARLQLAWHSWRLVVWRPIRQPMAQLGV